MPFLRSQSYERAIRLICKLTVFLTTWITNVLCQWHEGVISDYQTNQFRTLANNKFEKKKWQRYLYSLIFQLRHRMLLALISLTKSTLISRIIIIIIKSYRELRFPWISFSILPHHSSLPAGLPSKKSWCW